MVLEGGVELHMDMVVCVCVCVRVRVRVRARVCVSSRAVPLSAVWRVTVSIP